MNTSENTTHAERSLQLIVHTKVYLFSAGWNAITEETVTFEFGTHAFNFDYLLHVSGINYLVHPEDIPLIISFVKEAVDNPLEYHFRFINRSGETKTVKGLARLIPVQNTDDPTALKGKALA